MYVITFGAATTLALLMLFRVGQRVLAPTQTIGAHLEAGNTAHALLYVGQVLGVFLIGTAVALGCTEEHGLGRDVAWVSIFGASALALFALTGNLGVRMLLRSRLPKEIERGNVAAGIAGAAHYVATAIILARSVGGSDVSALVVSLVFFVIAQATLHLFVILFRALTSYDDAEEILGNNIAAALSYAGATIAISIIIGRAVEGTFVSWVVSLRAYAVALALNLSLYPVRQIVVQSLLLGCRPTLRGGRLDAAIAEDRSIGMGALEAIAYIATALLVSRLA